MEATYLFLHTLVYQSLCAIEDLRLPTVRKAVFQEDMLHDKILFMGIGTQIRRGLPPDGTVLHIFFLPHHRLLH